MRGYMERVMLGNKTYGQSVVFKNRIHRFHPLVPGWRIHLGEDLHRLGTEAGHRVHVVVSVPHLAVT
jgi:hypothetical protein